MDAGASAGGLNVLPEEYPDVKRSDFTETIHGSSIPDPYRWLEDPNSEETKECELP
jgi:prolyl oligopeptidase